MINRYIWSKFDLKFNLVNECSLDDILWKRIYVHSAARQAGIHRVTQQNAYFSPDRGSGECCADWLEWVVKSNALWSIFEILIRKIVSFLDENIKIETFFNNIVPKEIFWGF